MENNTIAIIFAVVILLSPFYLKKRQGINNIASTAVSLGMFGTFLGIFIGLLKFDVSDIQGSVPELLTGLKTAFLTSIAGLLTSLIVKNTPHLYQIAIDESSDKGDSENISKMIELLSNIEKGIAGDGETTLVTQIQKLRTSNVDGLNSLNKAFNEFAEKVVKDSSQSLIEALEDVIKDFNNKISEQFGENFKHLNAGVGKMLEWQMQYTSQVDNMTLQFQKTLEGVSESERTLTRISNQFSKFSDSSDKLDNLLKNLNTNLAGIEKMADSSKDIFPQIQSNIKTLTDNFSESVNDSVKANRRMFESQKIAIDTQINSLSSAYDSLGNIQHKMITELDSRLEKLMVDNATRITEQLQNLDEELGEELTKSLNTLGSQLSSLSAKFVNDYEPLTDKLRAIIEISNTRAN